MVGSLLCKVPYLIKGTGTRHAYTLKGRCAIPEQVASGSIKEAPKEQPTIIQVTEKVQMRITDKEILIESGKVRIVVDL